MQAPEHRQPTAYVIPRGTRGRPCWGKTCKKLIYLVPNADGGKRPLSVNTELHPQCAAPTADADGRGVLHFIDCPDRNDFKKPGLRGGR